MYTSSFTIALIALNKEIVLIEGKGAVNPVNKALFDAVINKATESVCVCVNVQRGPGRHNEADPTKNEEEKRPGEEYRLSEHPCCSLRQIALAEGRSRENYVNFRLRNLNYFRGAI
ncbi:hypothetical protein GWI33_009041 [Rhynchophorus ferrugineus]|uniref:Uncharacterized protein n=1 Tax=Rhynchophorus ferrugineus TaxID=354439 RepID=A0A834IDY4_RHYFE|nr:hypothetical protein GWI33_009041 [Rhynchophorus ferrugineus]